MKYNKQKGGDIKKKNFTIVDFPQDGKTYGTFNAINSKIAADEAFSHIYANVNIGDDSTGKFIVFTIKETNTNRHYKYIGTRIKLENPVKNDTSNKVYNYKNVVGKYNPELDKISEVVI